MKLLLDTHVFLWWRLDAPQLGRNVRAAVMNVRNQVLISAAVAWEIVIKRSLGKLRFDGSVAAACAEEGFTALAAGIAHVDEISRLADIHSDPFDRLLIAQARIDHLTLVTGDTTVLRYTGFDSMQV